MSQLASPEIDLTDLSLFARGAPHEIFAHLRREAPIHWHPEREGPGFWSLTRYADVREVSLESALSSERLGNMIFDQFTRPDDRSRMMIELDPPAHTRQRALVNRGFSPRMTRRLEPFAREVIAGVLDAALARGGCDFVADVAGVLPTQIIAEMMGVPPENRPRIYALANRIMAFADPEFGGGSGGANVEAMAQMQAFAAELGRARRSQPADDIASILLDAEIDGDRLTDEEFQLFFLMLITAGIETTRSAVAGGVLAFDANPDQWKRLQTGEVGVATALEEVLRWTTPIHHFRRTASHDFRLRDQEIREGDKVVFWYSSANRDEEVFEDASRFDVARSPNEHLAFGIGRHFCLGASLARMELEVMLESLLERDLEVELAGEPRWMRSNFAQSPVEMPVVLRTR